MWVRRLGVHDFRSYEEELVELGQGVTTFVGSNGQGKTNLVEALGYAASLGSHRVATDAPLVRTGATKAVVRAEVMREDRATLIEIEIVPGASNRARVNRVPVPRAREVLGTLRTVLFAPEDLALVKGDPGDRRRFLDELLVARSPRFAGIRSDYDRVLKQRTTLLKSAAQARGRGVEETLGVWDEHLSEAGAQLVAGRALLVDDLTPHAEHAYAELAPGSAPLGLSIASSIPGAEGLRDTGPIATAFREALVHRRREELDRGVTLVGPHRDDLVITLGDSPAKGYASHGESWSCALALRLASFELLRGEEGGDPVLVLDDVFAELDSGRRQRLAEMVAPAEQVLITAAVDADVPAPLTGTRLRVSASHVSPASVSDPA